MYCSKFSHDADPEVAHNSIFGLGLIGAGTNNARLAATLRQLAQYHSKVLGYSPRFFSRSWYKYKHEGSFYTAGDNVEPYPYDLHSL
jgi:hypothetical protein